MQTAGNALKVKFCEMQNIFANILHTRAMFLCVATAADDFDNFS